MFPYIKMVNKVELMAPAGNFESLNASIKAGANSVYFGIKGLNMRSLGAKNFELTDLKKISEICKKNKVKTYLTLNTVIYDNDFELMKNIINEAKKVKIDAIIAMDFSVFNYCKDIGMEVHTSTQANVSNIEAVKFFSKFAETIVLARELSLEQIKNICNEIKKQKILGPKGKLIKIEIFVHGALCVAISGKCYMSLASYNKSANRGECLQVCRRKYRVIDDETNNELVIDNNYVMSPKDLCTIRILDKIIQTGVFVLKIEGRGRSADYVYETVKVYREAIDAYYNNNFSKDKILDWEKRLSSVFNRGFWHGGYYLNDKTGEWSGIYGSNATKKKIYVGDVVNYYSIKNVADIELKSEEINIGDEILIIGNTTYVKSEVKSIHTDKGSVKKVKKGIIVSINVPEKVRKNDKVYVLKKNE
jgi:U32 family peptidase